MDVGAEVFLGSAFLGGDISGVPGTGSTEGVASAAATGGATKLKRALPTRSSAPSCTRAGLPGTTRSPSM